MPDHTPLEPGLYEHVVTRSLERAIAEVEDARTRGLDVVDAHVVLAQHLSEPLKLALAQVAESEKDESLKLARQIELTNAILEVLRKHSNAVAVGDEIAVSATELLAIPESGPAHRVAARPRAPLRSSALLVNGRDEPSIGQELPLEIESADEILLLCAFLKWSGVRVVIDALRAFTERGGRLRVITTTYCAATEVRALEALREIGAEIRISYETKTTRLHAKAWLFERSSGLSTVYVGSSNLSYSALVDGLEWNVRLSQAETPAMVTRFRVAFESLWLDEHVEEYDREAFETALHKERGDPDRQIISIDLNPYPFQRAILERLDVERHRHNRWRNLIVAATGTGKTVIAALDYQRLRGQLGGNPSLLFVAHRERILAQSRAMFQIATHDPSFGEMYVDGRKPADWKHVFASVQSLKNIDLTQIDPKHFDVIIVDEFHHAAAPTYTRLLEHFDPKVLVGLTATPERKDEQDIMRWFGGRFAAEIRLWDALEGQMLVPFHYFGINDDVDLSSVAWRASGYDVRQLENLYTGDDARVLRVVQQVRRYVNDPLTMKALGFCVSVEHAKFMAAKFNERGIPSIALDGSTPTNERAAAIRQLQAGELACLFSVDIFNEGIDIPTVDTILMLRPTESATVFIQQLGRGLRRAEGKSVCTVLDFIGNQRKEFRFAPRFMGMLGVSRKQLIDGLEQGFPSLPAGIHFSLDRVAREHVIANLKQSIGSRASDMAADLRALGANASLEEFLDESGRELSDVFRANRPGWTELRRQAGFDDSIPAEDDERLQKSVGRLLHVDDAERVVFYLQLLAEPNPPRLAELSDRERRLLFMLHLGLWGDDSKRVVNVEDGLLRLWDSEATRADLRAILTLHDEASDRSTRDTAELDPRIPLNVHGVYSRSEVLAAIGRSTPEQPYRFREGPLYMENLNADFFFITLKKSEDRFSPSTRYLDYAISRDLFHWETQSMQSPGTPTVQRYINHAARGSNVFLLVRERTTSDVGATSPFTFLGAVDYVKHEGTQPVGITWRLRTPMPEAVVRASVAAVG